MLLQTKSCPPSRFVVSSFPSSETCCNSSSSLQRLPEDSGYRVEVEQWYSYIKKVTTEKTDVRILLPFFMKALF
jgi:hypothetical protein